MSDEIVTGEGVALDVRPAGVLSRIGAQLIDIFIYVIVLGSVVVLVGNAAPDLDMAAAMALLVSSLVLVWLVVPTTVETLSRGKSVGKLVAGIRIVRDDGGPVRVRHAFIRALTAVLEIWLSSGAIALIVSLLNERGKRLGDYLAGTYAVRERTRQEAAPALVMPPFLAPWARIADIRRLPDGLALTTRQFLGRRAMLNPGSRAQLGLELAASVQQYVAPPPPAGTPPEEYLTAVLCARRDREYGMELVAMNRSRRLTGLVSSLPHGVPDPEN